MCVEMCGLLGQEQVHISQRRMRRTAHMARALAVSAITVSVNRDPARRSAHVGSVPDRETQFRLGPFLVIVKLAPVLRLVQVTPVVVDVHMKSPTAVVCSGS